MKKTISILLTAILALSLIPMTAFATEATVTKPEGAEWLVDEGDNHVWYKLEDSNTILTLGGTGAMPDFASDSPWHSAKDTIATVKVGSGITRIGESAFTGCDIANLYIEDLESWCKIKFACATSYPFRGEDQNNNLYVNGNLTTDLVIPDTITEIKDYTFTGFTNLTSVTIPSSVTSIGVQAFARCADLTSVTIPSSVTNIGDTAFTGCEGLTSVTIPSSVTSIGNRAFAGCVDLTNVTISSGVTSIGDNAFVNSSKLTSVTIPSSVTSIGSDVFAASDPSSDYDGCVSLTTVTVKATTPPALGTSAFPTSNVGFKVYVPSGTLTDYQNANNWKSRFLKSSLAEAYIVDDKPTTNGTVTMSKDCFPSDTYTAANETVAVTVTPNEGYQLKSLKYNDGEDHDITSAKSFTMPKANVTVTAEFEEKTITLADAIDAAKKALDAEDAKDPLTDKTALTNGKNNIDKATTKEAVENAKNSAITAIQEAQASELADAIAAAKKALDTEEAKEPLTDKTALTNGKNNIDKATTKAAVENAKNTAITAIQEAQAAEPVEYKITEGNDAKIELSTIKDTLFTSNADFAKFKEVLVDGKVVAPKYYDAKSGSTDVTLKKEYLETLSAGVHTLTIASTDGEASTKFTILPKTDPAPETGDRTNASLWTAISAVSLAALAACIIAIKKKKKA